MSSPPPPSLRALQAASIAILTSTAGLSASLSFFVIPRLLESPTPVLIRQFSRMLSAAHAALPLPLVLPSLLHAYLAYRLPGRARLLYAAAAALTLSALPYTSAAMMPINRKMLAKARAVEAAGAGAGDVLVEEITADEAETAHALADSWALRNLYRPAVAFAAGAIGLYAALS
ncbi:hypothetical protein F4820DRAFT_430173 [Hypoxylon rubiginosum]|uniref:Uncharacterized protein n=1 Tax=Hypoxylon rubiginosum TaxID=110542 RepID=A0ACB9YT41_9PEZI|nr:hypothetical protein F4820DRAFT_430173 [Hypoxylon rubiginosum]